LFLRRDDPTLADSAILISLDRRSEALSSTQEALRLTPNDTKWLALQQQTLTQLQSTKKEPSQAKSQPVSPFTSVVSPAKTLKVFFSYSHKDKEMQIKLEKYLRNLKRQYLWTL